MPAYASEDTKIGDLFYNLCTPRFPSSTFFSHIICWAYPATYYGYIFSQYIECAACDWFHEHGEISDKTNGDWMRNVVLKQGAGKDSKEMLKEFFGGKNPSVEPLLRRLGLV